MNKNSSEFPSYTNPNYTSIQSDMSMSQVNDKPGVNLNIKTKNRNQQKISINKLKRYKIGLIFFAIYVLTSISSFLIVKYQQPITTLNAFSETYIYLSFLVVFLFFSFILSKCASKSTYNIVNILKYYVPDWKKDMSKNDFKTLSSTFYIFEGTKEKFEKNVHKISFMLMVFLYFSMSFLLLSCYTYKETKNIYLIPLVFPLASLSIVVILRKLFLNTQQFDMLSTISLIILIIGIVFLFIFQVYIYNSSNEPGAIILIYCYATFGGLFFGLFSVFLKYFYNIYGTNFRISLIFGYIGLYNIIASPIILCLVCIWSTNDSIFNLGENSFGIWFGNFAINIIKVITAAHCVIGLSPLVFSMGMFLDCLINITVNIIAKDIESSVWYILSACFIFIGVFLGGLDKYLKNKIRDRELKEEQETYNLGNEKDE